MTVGDFISSPIPMHISVNIPVNFSVRLFSRETSRQNVKYSEAIAAANGKHDL